MTDFDVTKHVMVPYHEIMKEEEVKKILAKYNIQKEQLPKILATDPCALVLGAKAGQVLKIIRESKTAGKATAYRYVIEG